MHVPKYFKDREEEVFWSQNNMLTRKLNIRSPNTTIMYLVPKLWLMHFFQDMRSVALYSYNRSQIRQYVKYT